jgi:hypothetical protein
MPKGPGDYQLRYPSISAISIRRFVNSPYSSMLPISASRTASSICRRLYAGDGQAAHRRDHGVSPRRLQQALLDSIWVALSPVETIKVGRAHSFPEARSRRSKSQGGTRSGAEVQ